MFWRLFYNNFFWLVEWFIVDFQSFSYGLLILFFLFLVFVFCFISFDVVTVICFDLSESFSAFSSESLAIYFFTIWCLILFVICNFNFCRYFFNFWFLYSAIFFLFDLIQSRQCRHLIHAIQSLPLV